MRISAKVDYAVRASLELAAAGGERRGTEPGADPARLVAARAENAPKGSLPRR